MKVFNAFFKVYRTVLYLCIVIYMVVTMGPMLFGINPYIVLSGSMEPTIETGAVAFVQKSDSKAPLSGMIEHKEYKVGDIVAFKEGSSASAITVVHRIVGEDEDCFVTKGDNNDSADLGKLKPSQLVGHFMYSIPKFGYFTSWLQSKTGLMTAGIFCFVALASSFIADNTGKKKDNLSEETESHAGDESSEG